jgi:hypothetical protein
MTPITHDEWWRTCQAVTRVFFGALNGQINLQHPSNRPFPRDEPAEWKVWATAVLARSHASRELALTNAAFQNMADLLAASEAVAAGVRVPEPSAADLQKISEGLAKINEAVKADETFHAALDIGVALAGEIEKLRG